MSPSLLRHAESTRPNQVWAAASTDIPMPHGVGDVVAVLDWASRRVVAGRLSNTVTPDFCREAVQEAWAS